MEIKAFFGLDPKGAVNGMNKGKKAVRDGSQSINASLRAMKRVAVSAFAGWGIGSLGKDFAKAAMDMDSMRKSMSAAVGGMEKANREINYLRKTSLDMGLSFRDAGKDFKMLGAAAKGTALEGDGVRKVWKSLQNATVSLQLTTAETSGTVYAFKDMLSKGSVQAEELKRQLGNRLPGAFAMAARAMKMTTRELMKQMELGNIMTDDFLPAFAREMDKAYAQSAVESSKTMRAELNRMKTAWFDFQATFMETTGLSDLVSWSLKKVTDALTWLNENMDEFAEYSKVATAALITFGKWGKDVFIEVESLLKGSVSAWKYMGSNVSYYSQEIWYGFQRGALIAGKALLGFKKMMLDEFADMAFVAGANADKMGQTWLSNKMFESSDWLRESARLTQTIEEETQALIDKKEEQIAAIKPAITLAEAAKDLARIENQRIQKLKDNAEWEKKAHIENIKRTEERKNALKLRDLMPIEDSYDIPDIPLTMWEKAFAALKGRFEKLGAMSTDIAKNIESVFTSAFKGIEDAFAQMVTKGKIDWRSLADSMLADMARLAARQAVIGPLQQALGVGMNALAQWAGPGNTNIGTGNTAGTTFTGFDGFESGTVAGPGSGIGNTAGIEFTGIRSKSRSMETGTSEQGLNQSQIRSVSKSKQSAVSVKPIINISTPPGTQATTQTSGDGMNMDVMISMIEKSISANMRRGSGLSDTMQQMYGLNRSSGAMR